MGLTEFAQKINYQRALQGELERTIMALDAVESARVHLSLPDSSIFRDDRRPPKASVTLTMRPGRRLSPEMVSGVQNLIAASTPDLEAANVFVLDEHGAIVSENAVGAAASSASGVAANIEGYYAARIRRSVSQVYPDSDLDVSVEAVTRRALPATPASDPDVDAHMDPTRVNPGATTPSAAPDDDLPNALQAWTPAERRFALEVRLSVESPISPQLQQQMKTLAAQAVNLDAAAGDEVLVSTEQGGGYTGSSLFGTTDDAEPARVAPVAGTTSPTAAWEAVLAPALIILIGLAIFLGWSRAGAEHLTERKRDEYVRRLKFLLDKEEANASPPL
jgi:flagellar M-ring protein FliF